jgi:hypothetical protein
MSAPPDITGTVLALLGPYAPDDLTPGSPTPRAIAAYESLPAAHRAADDGTLLALVVAIADLTGGIELMVDALNYIAPDEGGPGPDVVPGGRSILTDLDRPLWVPWLAQAVGVDLAAAGITDVYGDDARDAVRAAVNGWRAGSRDAIASAARRTLTGARTVRVRSGVGVDPFVITVSTAAAETPDTAALRAAVEAVLPAGHALDLNNAVGSWAGIEELAPTWDDIEALTNDELDELYVAE